MREFGILIVGFAALLLGSANAFAADGAAVYKANCARCHGESGTADTPVAGPLGIKPFQGVTPERVEAAMGKPVHQSLELSPEELAAVAEVVAGFGSP